MKIIFMGTSEFAVPTLEQLIERNFDLVGVVTQPDRPSGRGKRLMPSPVKGVATTHNLPIYQPEKVRRDNFISTLRQLEPTVIVVSAFGQILPQSILSMAPCGCINIHPSLLPKYRGAAPIQWALINGETSTGITIMLLDAGQDTGDIIRQIPVPIDPDDNAVGLSERLAKLAAPLLIQVLEGITGGVPPPHTPQNHAEATHAPRLTKETGDIDWTKSAEAIRNLVRGTAIWPGAYTFFRENLRLKIIECRVLDASDSSRFPPGTIEITPAKDVLVFTAQGVLQLDQVQPANRKPMTAHDFLNGYHLKAGDRFLQHRSET